jgi:hypothetical protein
MQTMMIETNETRFAFRVNGVTFAKKHLANTLGRDCQDDMSKALAKFLVIVPFLATAFEVSEHASESIKYGAAKAKRMYKALGLNEDNTVPFMLICMAQTGADDPNECVAAIGKELRETGFYEGGKRVERPFRQREDNVVNLADHMRKPTLH